MDIIDILITHWQLLFSIFRYIKKSNFAISILQKYRFDISQQLIPHTVILSTVYSTILRLSRTIKSFFRHFLNFFPK